MRSILIVLALATAAAAQPVPMLMDLKQTAARPHNKLKFPKNHVVGPVIPGLKHGAVPQGLAFWAQKNWYLLSLYMHHEEKKGAPREEKKPSVVVAIDADTGNVVRCLTLVEPNGKAHTGHVGGLAVSDKYLWIGSEKLYRAPLADIVAADKGPVYLRLHKPFHAESDASFVAYHNKVVWVGEFVALPKYKGKTAHYLKNERTSEQMHAWICGYPLDANDNLPPMVGDKSPPPATVLVVRDHVQGLAFTDGRIILSASYDRTKDSHIAVYKNPLSGESKKSHTMVKVDGAAVPAWFLDRKNNVKDIDYPPMSEGVAVHGDMLAVICESGAERYKAKGHQPLDNIILFPLPSK